LEAVASFIRASSLAIQMNEPTAVRDLLTTTVTAGGADRDRTDDPRLAKPVLSQLSYSPFSTSNDDAGASR
jgi:hypothetical protein